MGKPLTIQEMDDQRLNSLKKKLKLSSKADVLRAGLSLLENQLERAEKGQKWRQAARLVSQKSQEVNRDFQKHSRFKGL